MRGTERREIFCAAGDFRHFLELLEEMAVRYKVRIHAYALMGNHYHLLIETPLANLGQAMQWLNVSYGVWFNRHYQRVGPLFQGRYKSVLVDDEGGWALEASRYLHMNPVRVSGLGLGKNERRQEQAGRLLQPTREEVTNRLKMLREYEWSSYRVYAGYRERSGWLTTKELLGRIAKNEAEAKQRYREKTERMIRQGVEETEVERWRGRVAVGRQEFMERVRRMVKANKREQPQWRQMAQWIDFEDVVKAVENMKREEREEFWERRGDWGRDMTLALARKWSGMSLRDLGEAAGGMDYGAVSEAVRRLERRLSTDKKLRQIHYKLTNTILKIET
jgi:REP element-mobilizing transposase RayT